MIHSVSCTINNMAILFFLQFTFVTFNILVVLNYIINISIELYSSNCKKVLYEILILKEMEMINMKIKVKIFIL